MLDTYFDNSLLKLWRIKRIDFFFKETKKVGGGKDECTSEDFILVYSG